MRWHGVAVAGLVVALGGGASRAEEVAGEVTKGVVPVETKTPAEWRREILAWRKALESPETTDFERQAAVDSIEGIADPAAVSVLGDLWEKERSFVVRQHYVNALKHIGGRSAFFKLVEVAVEETNRNIRKDAASWIATQENRNDAIPFFVRYLRSKTLHHAALDSLGYTEITKNPQGEPDPKLIAALKANLITVTPVRKRVPWSYDSGWHYLGDDGYRRLYENKLIWVTTYEMEENKEAKSLLQQYTRTYPYPESEYQGGGN